MCIICYQHNSKTNIRTKSEFYALNVYPLEVQFEAFYEDRTICELGCTKKFEYITIYEGISH